MQYLPAGPPSILECANACSNNVDQIVQFVYNNIDFYPIYGVQKGALGCLIDGMGGPWDQCSLLVALLTQAGSAANFITGQITLSEIQLSNWLGTNSITAAGNLLTNAAIPHTVNGSTSITLNHVWVECSIGGTNYVFDPSFKTYSYTSGINISSAMSYNQTTFISAATAGSTITGNSVLNLNASAIKAQCATYAQNLENYITTNLPSATIDSLLGQRTIVQNFTQQRNLTLSYGSASSVFANIPNSYRTTLNVQYQGINSTLYSDQLCNQSLTLSSSGGYPILALNGSSIAVGTLGSGGNVTYTVTSNAASFTETNTTSTFVANAASTVYRFDFMWGFCGRGSLTYHQDLYTQAQRTLFGQGSSYDPELIFQPAVVASLDVGWAVYCTTQTRYWDLLGRLRGSQPICFFHGGITGFIYNFVNVNNQGQVFMDLTLGKNIVFSPLNNTNAYDSVANDCLSVIDNGVEGLTLRQQYAVQDLNNNYAIDQATANGVTIYDMASGTFNSLSSNLINWSASATLGTYLNAGARCLVVSNGRLPVIDANQVSPTINNCFYGAMPASKQFSAMFNNIKGGFSIPTQVGDTFRTIPAWYPSKEPINYSTGHYIDKVTDLLAGPVAQFPYSLDFTRYYDSGYNTPQPQPSDDFLSPHWLGYGWRHNWEIQANSSVSDILQTLGDSAALFSAANISALVIQSSLLNQPSTDPMAYVLISALVDRWKVGQVTNNIVVISYPNYNEYLISLTNGTFTSITGSGSSVTYQTIVPNTLLYSAGASGRNYTYTNKYGQVMTFNQVCMPLSVTVNPRYPSRLTQWSFPNGVDINLAYNTDNEFDFGNSMVSSVSNNLGVQLNFTYSSQEGYTYGALLTVDDNQGNACSYLYPIDSEDKTGFALSVVFLPRGDALSYSYNSTSYPYPGGPLGSYIGGMIGKTTPISAPTVIVENFYNDLNTQVVSQLDFADNFWFYTYQGFKTTETDPAGNAKTFVFDSNGNLLSFKDALGNTTTYTYDAYQRLNSKTLPEGNSSTYTYDSNNNILTVVETPKPGSGLSTITASSTYSPTWNKPLTITDYVGNTTHYSYDGSGNLSQINFGNGSQIWQLAYNGYGQMISLTNPASSITNLYYTNTYIASSVIDASNLAITTQRGYDTQGNCNSVTDPTGNTTSYTYNPNRAITSITSAAPFSYPVTITRNGMNGATARQMAGLSESWSFNIGNYSTKYTDPLGNSYSKSYNTLQKVSAASSPLITVSSNYDQDARYNQTIFQDASSSSVTFTNNGLIKTFTDQRGYIYRYTYDGLDRKISTLYPDNTTEAYTYNSNGKALTYTNRASANITYTYDYLSRISTKAPSNQPTVTYNYNPLGDFSSLVFTGLSTGSVSYTYDTAGRCSSETSLSGKQLSYVFDPSNNLTKMTWPDGYYVTKTYDALNRISSIYLNGSGSPCASFTYDALNRITQVTYGNGVVTTYSYQGLDRLTALSFAGNTISYSYDANGRETGKSGNSNLIWSGQACSITNPSSANSTNEAFPFSSSTYDLNGCYLHDSTWTYTYDTEKRLTSAISTAGASATYTYDPASRLVTKTVGGTQTQFLYSGATRVGDYSSSGALQYRYVHGYQDNIPLLMLDASGNATYFHKDKGNSLIAVSSPAGSVTNFYTYSPFGESASSVHPSGWGFTGQRYDSETGLYYYNARHYNPAIGRFLQPDLIQSPNRYPYCASDPLNNLDITGKQDTPAINAIIKGDPFYKDPGITFDIPTNQGITPIVTHGHVDYATDPVTGTKSIAPHAKPFWPDPGAVQDALDGAPGPTNIIFLESCFSGTNDASTGMPSSQSPAGQFAKNNHKWTVAPTGETSVVTGQLLPPVTNAAPNPQWAVFDPSGNPVADPGHQFTNTNGAPNWSNITNYINSSH